MLAFGGLAGFFQSTVANAVPAQLLDLTAFAKAFAVDSRSLRLESRAVDGQQAFPTLFQSNLYLEVRDFAGGWRFTDQRLDKPIKLEVTIVDLTTTAAAGFAALHPATLQPFEPTEISKALSRVPIGGIVLGGEIRSLGFVHVGRLLVRIATTGPEAARSDVQAVIQSAVVTAQSLPVPPDLDRRGTDPMTKAFISILTMVLTPAFFGVLVTALKDRSFRARFVLAFRHRRDPTRDLVASGHDIINVSVASRRRRRRLAVKGFVRPWLVTFRGVLVVTGTFAVVKRSMFGFVLLAIVTLPSLIARLRRRSRSEQVAQMKYRALAMASGRMRWALIGLAAIVLRVGAHILLAVFGVVWILGTSLPETGFTANVSSTFELGVLFFVFGIAAAALPRRVAQRSGRFGSEKVVNADGRAPILLLRSFDDDSVKLRTRRSGRHTLIEKLSLRRWDRFEELLSWQLWKVGPVVTAADPERESNSGGAVRDRHTHDSWQGWIRARMDRSQLVAVCLAESESLDWEINQLRNTDALPRTIFLIPPLKDLAAADARIAHLSALLEISMPSNSQKIGSFVIHAIRVTSEQSARLYTGRFPDEVSYEIAIDRAVADAAEFKRLPPWPAPFPMTPLAPPHRPSLTKRSARLLLCSLPAVVLTLLSLGFLVSGFATLYVVAQDSVRRPSTFLAGVVRFPPPVAFVAATSGLIATTDPSGDIQVVDTANDTASQRVSLNGSPSAIGVGDGLVAIADLSHGTIDFWQSGRFGSRHTVRVDAPFAVAINADYAVGLSALNGIVSIVPTGGGPVGIVKVGGNPLAATIVGHMAYVVKAESNDIAVVDLDSQTVVSRFRTCTGPRDIVRSNDGFAVACETGQIIASHLFDGTRSASIRLKDAPIGLTVSTNNRIFAIQRGGDAVSVGDGKVVALPRGRGATSIAYEPLGQHVFLALPGDGEIGEIAASR